MGRKIWRWGGRHKKRPGSSVTLGLVVVEHVGVERLVVVRWQFASAPAKGDLGGAGDARGAHVVLELGELQRGPFVAVQEQPQLSGRRLHLGFSSAQGERPGIVDERGE